MEKQEYLNLKEDYDYLLKMIEDKNEEISKLEDIIDSLITKIQKLENKIKNKK